MAGGVSFDKGIMDAAAELLDSRTDEELYKKFTALKDRIETEIGTDGTKWSGNTAGKFHDNFVNEQVPEFETLHKNIHNIADNIREQASSWQNFDEQ